MTLHSTTKYHPALKHGTVIIVYMFAVLLVAMLMPDPSFSAETSLALDSMPGDYTGQGQFQFYSAGDGTFTASRNYVNGVSLSFISPGYENRWYLYFVAPNNELLAVGVYPGATDFPSLGTDSPGLYISGDGWGCDGSGSFEVKEITYGTDDEIISFWAVFEQKCAYDPASLRGEIRFNASAPNTITTLLSSSNPTAEGQTITFTARVAGSDGTPAGMVTFKDGTTVLGTGSLSGNPATAVFTTASLSVQTHAITAEYSGDVAFDPSISAVLNQTVEKANATVLLINSDDGEVIGQGDLHFFQLADGIFSVLTDYGNAVIIAFQTPGHDQWWRLAFAAPNDELLTAGVYSDATRFPFQSDTAPGMDISGNGTGCNDSRGSFEVKEVIYDDYGDVRSFWATFEQYCQTGLAALRGEIRVNAASPDSVTVIDSSLNPVYEGQPVTYTATVRAVGGTPTGEVMFMDGTTVLGTSALSGSPAIATIETSFLKGGPHSVTAVYLGGSDFDSSASFALTQHVMNKAVGIIYPNGGETLASGRNLLLQWMATDEAVSFKIKYSCDNGITWLSLLPYAVYTNGSWSNVPRLIQNRKKCLIKVVGYDANNVKVGADISDAPFAIEVVRLISPNGGGPALTSGQQVVVTWTTNATKRPVARAVISYSKDGGTTWIRDGYVNGNPGTYDWKVPVVVNPKNNCKVKVELKDAAGIVVGSDVSDLPFSIFP